MRIVVDPENATDDFMRENNTLTLKIPVWDKGLVQGYIQDGSIGRGQLAAAGGREGYADGDGLQRHCHGRQDRPLRVLSAWPYGDYHIKIEQPDYNTFEEDYTLAKRCPS